MNSILFDSNGTLRSGWRAAIFFLGFVFLAILLGVLSQAVLFAIWDVSVPRSIVLITNGATLLIPAILVGWLSGRFLERLPFAVLGASFNEPWFRHLLAGGIVGALSLGLAVAIAFVFGGLRFQFNDAATGDISWSLTVSFIIFGVMAAFEESFFRGYLLQTFARSGLAWLAIVLTSLFFGAVHYRNPNASLISTANTILAGVWFAVAYLQTRDLWFVWGLHLMWNWMQGSFFGIEVSGLTDITTTPLLKEIDSGPTWLTGQTYGIEGGIACTIGIVISMTAIHFLPIGTGPQASCLPTPGPPA